MGGLGQRFVLLFSTPIFHFLPDQSGYKRGRGLGKSLSFYLLLQYMYW